MNRQCLLVSALLLIPGGPAGAQFTALELTCDPDEPKNKPAPDGVECLPSWLTLESGEQIPEFVFADASLQGAEKGDLVASPGGPCGTIGGILHALKPEQHYSHLGIMAEDGYKIRHSTSIDERQKDAEAFGVGELFGQKGTDGLRADVVRYGYPGTITQTVRNAYWRREEFMDPEQPEEEGAAPRRYLLAPFSFFDPEELTKADEANKACLATARFSLVRMPASWEPPELPFEANGKLITKWAELGSDEQGRRRAEVRAELHAVADQAMSIEGYYHFAHYTDASFDGPAPESAGWAVGRVPTMCSSLAWMAAKAAGLHLEGVLEPTDEQEFAEKDLNTLDGLYLYQAEDRLEAGNVLWQRIYDTALAVAGQDAENLDQVASDWANQFANTFAGDLAGCPDVERQLECTDPLDVTPMSPQFCGSWPDFVGDYCCCAIKSQRWQSPGVGRTVSPQDTIHWDGPEQHGSYGHWDQTVKLISADYVRVYRWQSAADRGIVQGSVVRAYEQTPVADALVKVGGVPTRTDANGKFTVLGLLPDIPHDVTAFLDQPPRLPSECTAEEPDLTGSASVTVAAGATQQVTVQVTKGCPVPPQTEHHVRVTITPGTLKITDKDVNEDDWGTFDLAQFADTMLPDAAGVEVVTPLPAKDGKLEIVLDPVQDDVWVRFGYGTLLCVDEVATRLNLHLHLDSLTNQVTGHFQADLYEWTDSDGFTNCVGVAEYDHLDATVESEFSMPQCDGSVIFGDIQATNPEDDGGDTIVVSGLTFSAEPLFSIAPCTPSFFPDPP